MSEHFLTEIEIKEFKCFTDFKASGFKRVNLIGGKNNVGKTAFMEACLINVYGKDFDSLIYSLFITKFFREKINLVQIKISDKRDFLDSIKFYNCESNLNLKSFFIEEKDAKKDYKLLIDDKELIVNYNNINFNTPNVRNIRFIDNFGFDDGRLVSVYEIIQKLDKENELNELVSEFDGSIINFKVISEKPQCKTNDEYRDIVEFGDGLKHYISIICALYACKNGYLFIDEIDNGIHYTQLDRLWKIILTISKTTNCQVFATTHSKEMIDSFARVAKKLDEQDISYTVLVKNDQKEIKALTRDYAMFLDSIEQEHEVRGW